MGKMILIINRKFSSCCITEQKEVYQEPRGVSGAPTNTLIASKKVNGHLQQSNSG